MKKVISLVLLASMSVSVLAGCGKAADSSSDTTTSKSNVTLTVLTNRTDIVGTDLKKFGDDYKTKTGVTIKWEAITKYEDDVKIRLNSRNYGDVLLIPNGVASSDFAQFFEPLGKNTDDKLKDYNYADYKATKNTDGSFTTYGLSYGMSASGIVYNKAAFKKAGIEKFPTTLTGLYEAAAKLKTAGVVPVATNFKDKWPFQEWDSLAVVESGDGSYMNTIYKDTTPFSADKAHGKALSVLYKFISSGWVEPDLTTTNWEASKTDLGTGKVGMMFLGTWAISQMQGVATNKDDIGFAAIPTDDSGKLAAICGADYTLAVSKASANKDEAKAFLYAFVDSDYGDKNGFIPIKKGVSSTSPVIKDFTSGIKLLMTSPGPNGDETDKRDKIGNKATIDFYGGAYVQTVAIAAKTSKAAFDKALQDLNDKWAKAKKDLSY
ncbi:MAG: carbohydrate ABC transporter substrate-binding protein [Clostridiaceae bacterium]|nr:carbohydrate ABC transporter substrate-binding protein [Clostridiaceae bacterium]